MGAQSGNKKQEESNVFEWSERRIEWYERALAFTGYAAVLADALEKLLPEGESVCDLGCGTGYLARELARRGYDVCGVDRSGLALSVLRSEKERLGLERLTVLEGDWNDYEASWDNVVMVSAGHFDKELTKYLSLCRKRLILVVKEDKSSHVLPKGEASPLRLRDYLVAEALEGLDHSVEGFSAEFGQPLRDADEAREYITYFGGNPDAPGSAMGRLRESHRADFPYYLPNRSEKLIYRVDK